MTTTRTHRILSGCMTMILVLAITASLLGAVSKDTEQTAALRKSLNESFGANLPFDRLPTVAATGEPVSITSARAMSKTKRNIAVRKRMKQFFPADTKGIPAMWRDVQGVDGKRYKVPNETHAKYRQFAAALDNDYQEIDTYYQKHYGDKFKEFSEGAYKEMHTWQKAGWETDVQLQGNFQNTIQSDIDATFKNARDRDHLVALLKAKGLTVEPDPQGHGLYVKVKELDYVLWGKETVGDIQKQYDNATDLREKTQIKQRLDAAMRDQEVCATTAGARNLLFGTGVVDDQGAKLDLIKKFAQADDLYTKNKVVAKMTKFDMGSDAYKRSLDAPGNTVAKKFNAHATNAQAMRTEGQPEPVKALYEKQFVATATNDLVDSYRMSAVKSTVENQIREKTRDTYLKTAASMDPTDATAQNLRRMAAQIDQDLLDIRKSNARTLKAISDSNPELGRRLRQAEGDALRVLNKDPQGTQRAVRDPQSLREICRMEVETKAPKKAAWMPVAKDAATSFIAKTDMVFDAVGVAGGIAKNIDEGLALEAAGKGSAAAYIAKGVAADLTLREIAKRNPKIGSVMQVMYVPTQMTQEMELQLDKAAAGSGNYLGARITAIVNVMKRNCFAEKLQTIMNEEGMAEVDREMQNGNYSWTMVALRTTARTVGEITQVNDLMRYGMNHVYGVHSADKATRLSLEALRRKAVTKGIAAEKNLERLGDQIIRLKLLPNSDDPAIQTQIRGLQAQFDQGMNNVLAIARPMRKQFSGQDKMVDNLYRKVKQAKMTQKTGLMEAEMIQIAGIQSDMSQSTYTRLKRIQKDYNTQVQAYQARTKVMHDRRGGGDPLVQQMMARLRGMKNLNQNMATFEFDSDAQYVREDQAKRQAKAQYEQALNKEIYAHAAKGGLPDGVTVDDQALLIELDDLKQQQADGDIPKDADLLTMAGNNVWDDIQYQRLVQMQKDGEIPADADLSDMFAKVKELYQKQLRGDLAGDLDLVATVASGGADALIAQEAIPPTPPDPIEIPPFPGADGTIQVQPVQYIKTFPPYLGKPKKRTQGNEVYLEETVNRNRNGAYRVWQDGKLTHESGSVMGKAHGPSRDYANGRLTSEMFYKNGKRHGLTRAWHANGKQRYEAWHKEGEPHGWSRSWNEQGVLIDERASIDGIEVCDRDFGSTGWLQFEHLYDLGKERIDQNGKAHYAHLQRRYHANGTISSIHRYDEHGKSVGLQISGHKSDVRTEYFYNEDNEKIWQRKYEPGDYLVGEQYFTQANGKTVFHGIYTEWFEPDSPRKGEIRYQCGYDEGVPHGSYQEVRYDGSLKGELENGLLTGRWEYRDKEGKLTTIRTFREGLSDGLQQVFYPDGTVKAEITVSNHVPVLCKAFYENGQPKAVHQGPIGKDKVKESPAKATASNNTAQYKVYTPNYPMFNNPVFYPPVTGSVKRWYWDSSTNKAHLDMEFEIKDGKFSGTRRSYYRKNGKLKREENCKDGLLDGVCTTYYNDGTISHKATMKAGRCVGMYQYRKGPGQKWVEVPTQKGFKVGWVHSYGHDGSLQYLNHFTVPVEGESRVFESEGVRLDQPWKGHSFYVDTGALNGPKINVNRDGTLGYTQYRMNNEKGYSMTHNVDDYLEWCKEYDYLPTEIPGYGKVGSKTKIPTKPKPKPVANPQPKPASVIDFSKAKVILEKDVSMSPKGLSRDKVHELMMKLWGDINKSISAKEYRVAEYKAVYAAKLARAYKQWEIRALYISYEKAAQSASRSGSLLKALKYLDISKQAALDAGDSDMVKQIEAKMKDYSQ